MDKYYPPPLTSFLPPQALNLSGPVYSSPPPSNRTPKKRADVKKVPELCVDDEFLKVYVENEERREKRRREREQLERGMTVDEQAPHVHTVTDRKQLYGDGYSRILELESKMNSKYKSVCDKRSVNLWPVIPLRE